MKHAVAIATGLFFSTIPVLPGMIPFNSAKEEQAASSVNPSDKTVLSRRTVLDIPVIGYLLSSLSVVAVYVYVKVCGVKRGYIQRDDSEIFKKRHSIANGL